MSSMQSRPWKVNNAFKLHWHTWEDDTVIYNTGSGDTHHLDAVSAKALHILETNACSPNELAYRLSSAVNHDLDDEFFEYVEKLLRDFSSLNLIIQSES